ncbi:MAG: hypothetical protein IIB87_04095, partial [Chloroflexi bacterium]|nr:hypothetical protein [Chloroflexota bacterium]
MGKRLLVLPLLAIALAVMVFAWGSSTDTAQSATGGAEMGMRVDTDDTQTCPETKTAGETCVGLGATFHVIISADAIPLGTPPGYRLAQVWIDWGATGLTFTPTGNPGSVAVTNWPDCNVAEQGLLGATFALQGCLTGFSNPPPSLHKGDLYTFEFNCTSGKSQHEIELIPLGVAPANTNGAMFGASDPSIGTNGQFAVPAKTLLVNCTNENTPVPPTATPTPMATATPLPPILDPVISLGAEGVDCGAETPTPTPFTKPAKCTAQFFPGQEKEGAFIVTINANLLPTPGYGGFQSEVVLSDGLAWNQRANCTDEVVWPDLSGETECNASSSGQRVRHNGRSASSTPFTNSNYVGTLVKLDVYCTQGAGPDETITLTKLSVTNVNGTTYFDENGLGVPVAAIAGDDADKLTINCEPARPEMSLRAVGSGVTCIGDADKPDKCTAPFVEEDPESAKFEILIEANAIPDGYGGFQTEVFFNGLGHTPRSCFDEVVWRPDDLAGFVCEVGPSTVERSVIGRTGEFPPFPASRYVGTLASFQVHCTSESQAPVSLTAYRDHDTDALDWLTGSAFYGTAGVGTGDADIDFIWPEEEEDIIGFRRMGTGGTLIPVLDVLRINC